MGLGGREPRQAALVQWTLATPLLTLNLPCPTHARFQVLLPCQCLGAPGGAPGPRQSPRVGGPPNLRVKQAGNRGPQQRGCLGGALTSCQLHVLGWGLSGPLSSLVAKVAQDPGQRRSPCTAPGRRCSSGDSSPGAPPGLPPTSVSKPSSKRTPGRAQACPPSAPLPLIFLFEGD